MLELSLFDYKLPEELIAAYPEKKRDNSKLLLLNRRSGALSHHRFFDLKSILKPGDLLVFNNTKVFPARLIGQKESGGKTEILLNRQVGERNWEVIGKGLKVGAKIIFASSLLNAEVVDKLNEIYIVRFNMKKEDLFDEAEKIGLIPLPPYIEKKRNGRAVSSDKERYQTVYAKSTGSAAAPTAGLHFTQSLIEQLGKLGIERASLTLHVGLGTFQPIKVSDVTQHHIHEESYSIGEIELQKIIRAKQEKRRVIAVGTTTTRVLEHIFSENKDILEGKYSADTLLGKTEIFIYPGFKFQCVDGIITNFHLPKSSLLLLISAFAGLDKVKQSYREAIDSKYRFYSYGDAMFIF